MRPPSRLLQAHPAPPRHRRLASRRGITLIEIMLVIAIIGLLMSVVGVYSVRSLALARHDAAKVHASRVAGLLQVVATRDRGRFPEASLGLDPVREELVEAGDDLEDPWGRPYLYRVSPDRRRAWVGCLGRDGEEGGEGPDADIWHPGLPEA